MESAGCAAAAEAGQPPQAGFSPSDARQRLHPSLRDFDYIHLSDLRDALRPLAAAVVGDVLDYGCGSMPYRRLFPSARSYRGADFPSNPQADLHLPPSGRLEAVGDSSVDVVVSLQVLEHVPDPQQYLAECHRVLRPGGQLLLSTHGTWEYHPVPADYFRWTHQGLEQLIRFAGFGAVQGYAVTDGTRALLQLAQLTARRAPPPLRALLGLALNLASVTPVLRRSRLTSWEAARLPVCLLAVAARPVAPPAVRT